jgi:glucose-1-phosphate thymidylyltransferase
MYIERQAMEHEVLEGWWTDAGTFESLLRATNLVAEGGANHVVQQPSASAVRP